MPENPLAADLDHILEHTRDLWDELRGQRIFITGGTGFFGCWLLESFIWANEKLDLAAQAVVLTRDPDKFLKKAPHLASNPSVQFWQGDIRDFAFPPGQFTYLIHAATEASARLNDEEPLVMLDTITAGTRRVLDFAAQQPLKAFLFTSSGAVYGKQPPDLTHIPETYNGAPDPLDPRNAYAEGKRYAELLCSIYSRQYHVPVKIARCFAFVGPYLPLDIHYAIGNFIRDALNGGPIVVKGDGTPYRSYLYAADLAIWLWTILLRGLAGEAYNVGSAEDYSIKEIANRVALCFDPAPAIEIRTKPNKKKLPERYIPDVSKAKEQLGLTLYTPYKYAIQKTIDWYQLEFRDNKLSTNKAGFPF
jgi:dTDP-glucose 4,6-dehydratase